MANPLVRQSLLAKFDKRWVGASLAAAGATAAVESAQAAIIYQAPVGGINVPVTAAGVYINVETGANSTSAAGIVTATAPVVNFWGTSAFRTYFYPSTTTVNRYVGATLSNLAPGTPINAASTYAASRNIFSPGAPWNSSAGTTGILGMKFRNDANTNTYYGWMRVTVNPYTGGTTYAGAKVIDWAYENSGAEILAGQVPEPATLALLALGAAGIIRRRRVA